MKSKTVTETSENISGKTSEIIQHMLCENLKDLWLKAEQEKKQYFGSFGVLIFIICGIRNELKTNIALGVGRCCFGLVSNLLAELQADVN